MLTVTVALAISLSLVLATVMLHYEVLRFTSAGIPSLAVPPRARILVVIAVTLIAHVMSIALYAVAYRLMDGQFGLGSIDGATERSALDYFYFSATSYTTLGVGDLSPHGLLRLVAGMEALNGFVLITWSASFTYLSMEKFWDDHLTGDAKAKRRDAA